MLAVLIVSLTNPKFLKKICLLTRPSKQFRLLMLFKPYHSFYHMKTCQKPLKTPPVQMFYERKRKRQSRGNRRSKGPVENVRRGSRSRKSSVISTRSSRSVKVDETEPEPEPETAAETPKSMLQVLIFICISMCAHVFIFKCPRIHLEIL